MDVDSNRMAVTKKVESVRVFVTSPPSRFLLRKGTIVGNIELSLSYS